VNDARVAEGAGDANGAASRLQKATMLAQALDDPALVAELLVDSSHVFASIREFRLASRFLERAREIAVEGNLEEVKGEVYRGYGALYKARGDLEQASIAFDRALEKLEFSSRHRSVCRVLLELSEIYLTDGRSGPALNLLVRAENLIVGFDPALEVRLRLNLGRLAHLAGERRQALDAYEAAARVARASDRTFDRELVCIGLAGLYLEDGQLAPSVKALREGLALSIVAFSSEPLQAIERARFLAMGQRLLELDVAANRAGPWGLHRIEVDEAVRLYNTHPLVLMGSLPSYGAVTAYLETPPAPDASAEPFIPAPGSDAGFSHPNPK
jgi:tetratricopeptide (TPR) repeat protein